MADIELTTAIEASKQQSSFDQQFHADLLKATELSLTLPQQGGMSAQQVSMYPAKDNQVSLHPALRGEIVAIIREAVSPAFQDAVDELRTMRFDLNSMKMLSEAQYAEQTRLRQTIETIGSAALTDNATLRQLAEASLNANLQSTARLEQILTHRNIGRTTPHAAVPAARHIVPLSSTIRSSWNKLVVVVKHFLMFCAVCLVFFLLVRFGALMEAKKYFASRSLI